MIVTLERLAFTHQARVVWGYVCRNYIRVLEGMLRTCVLDHKGRGLITLSGIRSDFSLDFRQIRPSAVDGARREAVLRRAGYTWTPGLRVFDNSKR